MSTPAPDTHDTCADHATGSTLVTLAAVVCASAGALAWTSVSLAGTLLVLAGLLAIGGGWFWDRAETGGESADEDLPSTVDVPRHATGRARPGAPWRSYPQRLVQLDRASRLRDSGAPVSHARKITRAAGGRR